MTVIETLSGVIAQRAYATKSFFENQTAFNLLKTGGLVQENGKLQSIVCDDCSAPHDAEVTFEGGNYGVYCHEAGFVPLEVNDVTAIEPNVAKLVADLAALFDCKRRKSSPVDGDTWRIGSIDTPGGDLALYFHPTLQNEQDVTAVETALRVETRSAFRLIITAAGSLSAASAKSAKLVDVVELDDRTGKLASFIDLRTIAGAPQTVANGRRSIYAEKLNSMILERIETGTALPGRNEEGREIAKLFRTKHPSEKTPSLSAINKYITNQRGGS